MAAEDQRERVGPTAAPSRLIDLTVFDDERTAGAPGEEVAGGLLTGHASRTPATAVAPVERLPTATRPRGLGVRVALVTTLLLTVAVGLAVVGFRRAEAWRQIALAQVERGTLLEERLDEAAAVVAQAEEAAAVAVEERDAAITAGERVSGQLGTSEQDVAALEQRLAVLASDKARLEDELAIAGRTRTASVDADELVLRCVQNIDAWLDRAPAAGEADPWQQWADEVTTWQWACDQATAGIR